MHKLVVVLFCLTGLTISACAVHHEPRQKTRVITQLVQTNALETGCGGLLIYYQALTELTKNELESERLILKKNLQESDNYCNQLRYVLYSMLPETEMKNDSEIEKILQSLEGRKTELQQEERQLYELLADQFAVLSEVKKGKKDDELKIEKLDSALKSEQQNSEELQGELDAAQTKLEQLKNIEKKIETREQEISTPSVDRKQP